MLEVETKLFLGNDVDSVRRKVRARGWEPLGETCERDTYYNGEDRDLIATEECLRTRSKDGSLELTWKPPSTQEMRDASHIWKREVNLDVKSQEGDVQEFLKALGYVPYVVVVKQRTTYRVDSETLVSIDLLEGLGTFFEVETMSVDAEAARRKNERLIESLGLTNVRRVSIPYRDLVKRGHV